MVSPAYRRRDLAYKSIQTSHKEADADKTALIGADVQELKVGVRTASPMHSRIVRHAEMKGLAPYW